jgi:hypothetical protein
MSFSRGGNNRGRKFDHFKKETELKGISLEMRIISTECQVGLSWCHGASSIAIPGIGVGKVSVRVDRERIPESEFMGEGIC